MQEPGGVLLISVTLRRGVRLTRFLFASFMESSAMAEQKQRLRMWDEPSVFGVSANKAVGAAFDCSVDPKPFKVYRVTSTGKQLRLLERHPSRRHGRPSKTQLRRPYQTLCGCAALSVTPGCDWTGKLDLKGELSRAT
jgi:hypothetical protein